MVFSINHPAAPRAIKNDNEKIIPALLRYKGTEDHLISDHFDLIAKASFFGAIRKIFARIFGSNDNIVASKLNDFFANKENRASLADRSIEDLIQIKTAVEGLEEEFAKNQKRKVDLAATVAAIKDLCLDKIIVLRKQCTEDLETHKGLKMSYSQDERNIKYLDQLGSTIG